MKFSILILGALAACVLVKATPSPEANPWRPRAGRGGAKRDALPEAEAEAEAYHARAGSPLWTVSKREAEAEAEADAEAYHVRAGSPLWTISKREASPWRARAGRGGAKRDAMPEAEADAYHARAGSPLWTISKREAEANPWRARAGRGGAKAKREASRFRPIDAREDSNIFS